MIPIFCDMVRFGLKVRHLRKHLKEVTRFYERNVFGPETRGEITEAYQEAIHAVQGFNVYVPRK